MPYGAGGIWIHIAEYAQRSNNDLSSTSRMPLTPGICARLRAVISTSKTRRWFCGAFFALAFGALAASTLIASPPFASSASPVSVTASEPIVPVPPPPPADPKRVALGERLFLDPRLSGDNTRSCNSCHDLRTNGATTTAHDKALDGSALRFNTPTVFNAALSFRFNWDGRFRSLESQAAMSIQNPRIMGSSLDEVVRKIAIDRELARQFQAAYGRGPNADDLVDAVATFERELITPDSRFDRWLAGDASALSAEELSGYHLFKSLGCVSCHQGRNIGGNLFQRQGIFHPLASPRPETLRVPSLRNVAATPPYFHDGSAPTLDNAVWRMAYAQLDTSLTQEQVDEIVAYLGTLTGTFRGKMVGGRP
jgi:cytochrome c peroxidase